MRVLKKRVYKVRPYPINRKKLFDQQWDILWYHLIFHAFHQLYCKFVVTVVIIADNFLDEILLEYYL